MKATKDLPDNCPEAAADCSDFDTNLPGNLRQERRRAAFLKRRLTPRYPVKCAGVEDDTPLGF